MSSFPFIGRVNEYLLASKLHKCNEINFIQNHLEFINRTICSFVLQLPVPGRDTPEVAKLSPLVVPVEKLFRRHDLCRSTNDA